MFYFSSRCVCVCVCWTRRRRPRATHPPRPPPQHHHHLSLSLSLCITAATNFVGQLFLYGVGPHHIDDTHGKHTVLGDTSRERERETAPRDANDDVGRRSLSLSPSRRRRAGAHPNAHAHTEGAPAGTHTHTQGDQYANWAGRFSVETHCDQFLQWELGQLQRGKRLFLSPSLTHTLSRFVSLSHSLVRTHAPLRFAAPCLLCTPSSLSLSLSLSGRDGSVVSIPTGKVPEYLQRGPLFYWNMAEASVFPYTNTHTHARWWKADLSTRERASLLTYGTNEEERRDEREREVCSKHAHTHTHTRSLTHTNALAHTDTRTHTRTHTRKTPCNLSLSPSPLPHPLSLS